MFSDTIHGHKSYNSKEIEVGVRFADMLREENGREVIDYTYFDKVIPLEIKKEEDLLVNWIRKNPKEEPRNFQLEHISVLGLVRFPKKSIINLEVCKANCITLNN